MLHVFMMTNTTQLLGMGRHSSFSTLAGHDLMLYSDSSQLFSDSSFREASAKNITIMIAYKQSL